MGCGPMADAGGSVTEIFLNQDDIAVRWRRQIDGVKKEREELRRTGGGLWQGRRPDAPDQRHGSDAFQAGFKRGVA